MFYGVSLLFKSLHSVASDDDPLWEFRVLLIDAISEEEAELKGKQIGEASEETYEAQKGDMVTWKFIQVESVSEIDEEDLKDGAELFSRFMSDSTVKRLLIPFDD